MPLPARFLHEAFDEPLRPAGFTRVGRRQVWMRSAHGIDHAVSLEPGSGRWGVRWDIVHPAVGALLHGRCAEPADVRYSGFITGWAQPALSPGVIAHFTITDLADQSLSAGVASAGAQVARWAEDFSTARGTIDFLTQSPGETLADARVIVPVHWPLRLFTAAGLAAVTREPDDHDLAERAIEALGSGSDVTDARIQRLRAALT